MNDPRTLAADRGTLSLWRASMVPRYWRELIPELQREVRVLLAARQR